MKRFTETRKWDDPWFWDLSPTAKLLWFYLLDHCDSAGFVEISLKMASAKIGCTVEKEHLAELESRLKTFPNGKVAILGFLRFQYGTPSRDCKAHNSIFLSLDRHGCTVEHLDKPCNTNANANLNPSDTNVKGSREGLEYLSNISQVGLEPHKVQEEVQERVQEKEKVQEWGQYHRDARTVLHVLNEASGRNFRETHPNLAVISARLREPGVSLEGVRTMITRQCRRWLNTPQAEYLRPETLFGKTKFDGYYAARDQPIYAESQSNSGTNARQVTGAEQRLIGIPSPLEANIELQEAIRRKQRERRVEDGLAETPSGT